MFVEPATGHTDTRCSEIAERRIVYLRYLRSTDKRLSVLGTYIAVACSVLWHATF
jgi:hypothetical protein